MESKVRKVCITQGFTLGVKVLSDGIFAFIVSIIISMHGLSLLTCWGQKDRAEIASVADSVEIDEPTDVQSDSSSSASSSSSSSSPSDSSESESSDSEGDTCKEKEKHSPSHGDKRRRKRCVGHVFLRDVGCANLFPGSPFFLFPKRGPGNKIDENAVPYFTLV